MDSVKFYSNVPIVFDSKKHGVVSIAGEEFREPFDVDGGLEPDMYYTLPELIGPNKRKPKPKPRPY